MDDLKPTPVLDMAQHLASVAQRENTLVTAVKTKLPEFATLCEDPSRDAVILHQDAFAAAYQDEEFKLLGMVIKYAGLNGKQIVVCGSNRETL